MRTLRKQTTDYLLVDISNSYTKLAFSTRRRLAKPIRVPTADTQLIQQVHVAVEHLLCHLVERALYP